MVFSEAFNKLLSVDQPDSLNPTVMRDSTGPALVWDLENERELNMTAEEIGDNVLIHTNGVTRAYKLKWKSFVNTAIWGYRLQLTKLNSLKQFYVKSIDKNRHIERKIEIMFFIHFC